MADARVLVADDHALFRQAVGEELEEAGFDVCAEAASAEEAVMLALSLSPALCLLDINMWGSGIDAGRAILERLRDTKIVILTAAADYDDFVSAVRAGARGFLLKDDDPRQFGDALREVLAGGTAYPHDYATRIDATRR